LKRIIAIPSWYILFLFLGFASCKASKKVSVDTPKMSALDDIVSKLEANSFHPEWFKAKASLQAKMDGQGLSFSSTIISKNKEMLWLNGKKFGIEGARFLITPDSIFALNRLQREYLSEEMAWVAEEYKLPQILAEAIDLEHMQDIFIGNPILDVIPYTEITNKENDMILTGSKNEYQSEMMVNNSDLYTRYFNLSDGMSTLYVSYSDYRKVDEVHAIAHRRDITIKRSGEGDIQLSIIYDNITINEEQKIKFDIPGNYSRM